MTTCPILLQFYSLREDAEKDLEGTLKAVQAMGYDGLELAGMHGRKPEELKALLETYELPAVSAHVPLAELEADLDGTLDAYKLLGVSYIAIPYLEEALRPGKPGFQKVLDAIPKIAEACEARGLTLLYHNHDFEFVKMDDGRYAFDYLYDSFPASVLQVEPDTCWIKVAGEDPVAYLKKYEGRIPVVHLKDFVLEGDPANLYELIGATVKKEESHGRFEFQPLGEGMQDIPAIAKAACEHGAKYLVVEQDLSLDRPPMEAARTSLAFLKAHGY